MLVNVGIIEELLNLIVNQVHSDEVYVAAANALTRGVVVGRAIAGAHGEVGLWEMRILEYIKKNFHRNFLFDSDSSKGTEFCNALLGDREVVRYIRSKLSIRKEEEKLNRSKVKRGKAEVDNFFLTSDDSRIINSI